MNKPIELYTVVLHDSFDDNFTIIYDGYDEGAYVTRDLSHAENLRDKMQRKFPRFEYRIYKLDEVIGSSKP